MTWASIFVFGGVSRGDNRRFGRRRAVSHDRVLIRFFAASLFLVAGESVWASSPVWASGPKREALGGRNGLPPGIVGGAPASPQDWPGVGAIVQGGSILCTGTLIHPRILLTAAHCTKGITDPSSLQVHFGSTIASEEGRADVSVVKAVSHPDFCGVPEEDCSDFGYLLFSKPLSGVEVVRVLATQAQYDLQVAVGSKVTLVGYGLDDDGASGAKRQVEAEITLRSTTGVAFGAGGDGLDSCSGDSGGPALVMDGAGQWALGGVLSYGSAICGDGGVYGVPQRALCWLSEDSGIDLRPSGCEGCDCIDLAERLADGGCDCALGPGAGAGWTLFGLVSLFLFGAVRRRSRTGS